MPQSTLFECRKQALSVHVSTALQDYILQLVAATRNPTLYGEDLTDTIAFGTSPRGTIAIDRCARVHAWLRGADFATPTDVQAIINDVLRHRIILSFEAEADGLTPDAIINELLSRVPVS